jgi:hypothetical protein
LQSGDRPLKRSGAAKHERNSADMSDAFQAVRFVRVRDLGRDERTAQKVRV